MPARERPPGRGSFFVNSLLPECEDEDLTRYFEKFGRVSRANVTRDKDTLMSKCCGTVLMADPSLVSKILETEHSIWEHPVTVQRHSNVEDNTAARGTSPQAGTEEPTLTEEDSEPNWLFIGRLSVEVGEKEVTDFFAKFGEVERTVLLKDKEGNSRKCAFVKMVDPAMVDTIVANEEGYEIDGKKITVRQYNKPRDTSSGKRGGKGKKADYGGSGDDWSPKGKHGKGGYSPYGMRSMGYEGYGGPGGFDAGGYPGYSSYGGYGNYGSANNRGGGRLGPDSSSYWPAMGGGSEWRRQSMRSGTRDGYSGRKGGMPARGSGGGGAYGGGKGAKGSGGGGAYVGGSGGAYVGGSDTEWDDGGDTSSRGYGGYGSRGGRGEKKNYGPQHGYGNRTRQHPYGKNPHEQGGSGDYADDAGGADHMNGGNGHDWGSGYNEGVNNIPLGSGDDIEI